MTVLVLTRDDLDAVADGVIAELTRRSVPVTRLDPGAFPADATMSARLDRGRWLGRWSGQHRDLDLESVRSVYMRRPTPFRVGPDVAPEAAAWAEAEARAAVSGVLGALDCTWVNHPHATAVADLDLYALAVAARCGLSVPDTLATSDPDAAREFLRRHHGLAAYKPVGRRGMPAIDGHPVAAWTSQVTTEEITDTVATTAHQFQQWIHKAHEVRWTAVADRHFAAEIHAGSPASRIDFRRDYDKLTYRVCDPPQNTTAGVDALMHALNLRYVALDFLVDHHGRWWLCDINPGGQYGFIPELRNPITQALADLLERTP